MKTKVNRFAIPTTREGLEQQIAKFELALSLPGFLGAAGQQAFAEDLMTMQDMLALMVLDEQAEAEAAEEVATEEGVTLSEAKGLLAKETVAELAAKYEWAEWVFQDCNSKASWRFYGTLSTAFSSLQQVLRTLKVTEAEYYVKAVR